MLLIISVLLVEDIDLKAFVRLEIGIYNKVIKVNRLLIIIA